MCALFHFQRKFLPGWNLFHKKSFIGNYGKRFNKIWSYSHPQHPWPWGPSRRRSKLRNLLVSSRNSAGKSMVFGMLAEFHSTSLHHLVASQEHVWNSHQHPASRVLGRHKKMEKAALALKNLTVQLSRGTFAHMYLPSWSDQDSDESTMQSGIDCV